jgi:beta-N-acetylhexosaminidase
VSAVSGELERLAAATLLPGYVGLEPPDWVVRRLGDGLGGIILYARNIVSPEQLRGATDALRRAREDVIVAIDEEGGDVTRLEAARGSSYPGNWALGHVDDLDLTRSVARAMGGDLAAVGVNLDLAPVADVNTNPDNPIIGIRSFGSDPGRVARHVAAFVSGLQEAGVAACAKHFPGHGDTVEDSHLELPTVPSIEEGALEPFRAAIEADARAIMTAHIRVADLGEEPATISARILGDLLRGELGYKGLVITDALEMRAISATIGVEEGAVRALAAGADALCLGHDLWEEATGQLVAAIAAAVREGRLTEERLVEAAGRVAEVGAWGSTQRPPASAAADVGQEAARRALDVEGEPAPLGSTTIVVELRPPPSIAVGEQPYGLGDALRKQLPAVEVVRLDSATLDGLGATLVGRDRVVVMQDAHRHAWQREAVDALSALDGRTVVVETGLPYWRPVGADAFVATHGSSRASLEAAADRLTRSG